MSPKRENRLVEESSPYLRQHAHNPVDWFPWGDEALARARQEDRPILLSVGYSACHWCHVMERESFENEAIARLMNEYFVNVKVDREERPDIDDIYMGAVQAMTGQGGWPMTVFLTPDLRPFYGGTYFPPEDRYGRPGFPRVLGAVAEYWRDHREGAEEKAQELMQALAENSSFLRAQGEVEEGVLDHAFRQLRSSFDPTHGGFGQAPKFPSSMSLALLLRYYRRSGSREALEMVELSLGKMARGGLYDQLGGGFHRYSVDARWLVPHFEKMLYDNALLLPVYLEAFQATGDSFYRRIAGETIAYVRREMTRPGGGFYATQDADSEGEEGLFFTWTPEEVEALLGEEEAALFCHYYGVVPEGNFEHGRSILHVEEESGEAARALGVEEKVLLDVLERGRQVLFAARQQRVAPARDDKIIASWNGLMISALARAHQVLGEEEPLRMAEEAARFVLEQMVEDRVLLHTYKDGRAKIPAYQDDYACMAAALLDLYEATFERRWLEAARELVEQMLARFWDGEEGGFFFTEAGARDLIVRTKSLFDNAQPSGNSTAALVLLRLAALRDDASLRERAEKILHLFNQLMRRAPGACAQMLCALDFYLEKPFEIALVGSAGERDEFLRAVHGTFLPSKVLLAAGQDEPGAEEALPLLEGKLGRGGRAYVCRDFSCSPPVQSAADLLALLVPGERVRP